MRLGVCCWLWCILGLGVYQSDEITHACARLPIRLQLLQFHPECSCSAFRLHARHNDSKYAAIHLCLWREGVLLTLLHACAFTAQLFTIHDWACRVWCSAAGKPGGGLKSLQLFKWNTSQSSCRQLCLSTQVVIWTLTSMNTKQHNWVCLLTTKWCIWRWDNHIQAASSAGKAQTMCPDVGVVAHMPHVQAPGPSDGALNTEANWSMQSVTKSVC